MNIKRLGRHKFKENPDETSTETQKSHKNTESHINMRREALKRRHQYSNGLSEHMTSSEVKLYTHQRLVHHQDTHCTTRLQQECVSAGFIKALYSIKSNIQNMRINFCGCNALVNLKIKLDLVCKLRLFS